MIKNFIDSLFKNFNFMRFLGQIVFYVGISLCALFNLTLINILFCLILLATIYFILVEPNEILNVRKGIKEILSVFETCITPFLQTGMVIVLYQTHHLWMLLLFLITEAFYIGAKKMNKSK